MGGDYGDFLKVRENCSYKDYAQVFILVGFHFECFGEKLGYIISLAVRYLKQHH